MIKETYSVIGLMSGTSLDGLDIAFCTFNLQEGKWQFAIHDFENVPYSTNLKDQLKQAVHLSAVDLLVLHTTYGRWTGKQVDRFLLSKGIKPDFVASHGHTIFHQPDKQMTYQMGCPQAIANECGCTVVADFRTLDVLLGGQGAPLVPIGDQLLFGEYDFCLNLGGISNVSFTHEGQRVAYDIGLANMLLNYLAAKAGKEYDHGGTLASTGTIDNQLLIQLNSLPYFQQPFPKSLGYEWFLSEVIPILEQASSSTADQLATAVSHINQMIVGELKKYNTKAKARLLVTGGGARNDFLMARLREEAGKTIEVIIPDPVVIDYKEAMVFAFMGVLRMRNEINCLRSVTGAQADCCGGVIFQAAKIALT